MIARVLRVDVEPGRIDDVLGRYRDDVRPIHARANGLLRHYVLADRELGRITIVGVWTDRESVEAIAAELEPARAGLWAAFGRAPELEIYDVLDELVP